MKSFTKAIIIKTFGIMLSAFIISISYFFYFYNDYKNPILLMILSVIGIIIFILSMKYEVELEIIEG